MLVNPQLRPQTHTLDAFRRFNELASRPDEWVDYAYDLSGGDGVDMGLMECHPAVAHSVCSPLPSFLCLAWFGLTD